MKLGYILQFFNPEGNDNIRKLVLDNDVALNSSGTWFLNDKRRPWASSLSILNSGFFEKQYEFLWSPEEISMTKDAVEFQSLDEPIKYAVENILSFLQYLDSVVPENDISLKFITGDYEIKQALSIHEFIEGGIHTRSYQYILKTLFGENSEKIKEVYYRFKNNPTLAERNKILVKDFQELRNLLYYGVLNTEIERYKKIFFRAVVQDYFIESVIFYMGFMFFHILSSVENVLQGTNQQIVLIRRDEELHTSLFQKIVKTFKEEEQMFYDEDIIYEIAYTTGEADKKFYKEILQDKISILTSSNIDSYIEYNINKRLAALGLRPIYSTTECPHQFKVIEAVNTSSELRKASFFETGSTDYFSTEDLNWEEKIKEELLRNNF